MTKRILILFTMFVLASATTGCDQGLIDETAELEELPAHIVEGTVAPECTLPTTVYAGGCTGTLVHPKAIITAQHCGEISSISFGPNGDEHTVSVTQCISTGSVDAKICELATEVTEIPPTPILFGCELETYRQVGEDVVIAGYGLTSYEASGSGGVLRWADQVITDVSDPDASIIGTAGVMPSPCPGDSGGPVYLQVDDGSWRVFGTVEGGTTGTPCNSAARFRSPNLVVPAFETATGIDVTPCFDGQTGAWDPGPDCTGFFAGSKDSGVGNWDNWCEGTPKSGYSDQCGEPFSSDADSDSDADGDTDADSDSDADNDSDPGSDNDDDSDGLQDDSDSSESSGDDTDDDNIDDDDLNSDSSGCGCTTMGGSTSRSLFVLIAEVLNSHF